MSIQESIKIVPQGEIAVVEFDLVGEKVNKFNTPVMLRLKEVLQELAKSNFKAIVFKSNKPKIFVAGADIDEIKNLKTADEVQKAVSSGQEIMNMVEDLPMVTVAAINGACMGGGCEFVLACDYRVASDDPSTKIGLPETKLGIIPGFGGCVRLPRVVGLQAALDIILNGKAVAASKAMKMGLVDQVCHPAILMDEAKKMANEKAGKKRRKTFKSQGALNKFLESPFGKPVVFSQAKKTVMKMTHGFYPAPLKAIEVVSKTYGSKNREKSLEAERNAFVHCALTDVSKNLIHVFYLVGSSRVDLQACKLEYSIVSPK